MIKVLQNYHENVFSLDGLDPNAYAAFQASRNLQDVVDRVLKNREEDDGKPGMSKKLSVRASLMTPVLPMLVSDYVGWGGSGGGSLVPGWIGESS